MEISGKVLREVEFRDRLRGYDTDEVDEFLEKVAVAVDELRAELEQAVRRADRAERRSAEVAAAAPAPVPVAVAEPGLDDDAIRRTLVLAQRTADLAIGEAREEASRLLDEAHAESEAMLARAEEAARRAREHAEQDVRARLGQLGDERERLQREIQSLSRLVEAERARLTESLAGVLRTLGESLTVSDAVAQQVASATLAQAGSSPAPAAPAGPDAHWSPRAEEPPVAPSSGWGGAPPQPGSAPLSTPEAAPADAPVPDVENEIAEDAATAYGGGFFGGTTGRVRPLPSEGEEAEEELWQRWAAGRDLGVVPAPSDFPSSSSRFGRGPGGGLTA